MVHFITFLVYTFCQLLLHEVDHPAAVEAPQDPLDLGEHAAVHGLRHRGAAGGHEEQPYPWVRCRQPYVLDSGPLIYLLFWDQQQTDASSAVDATDPSLDSCHCYSTSCVTACGAFPRGVRPPGTLSVLSKERGSLRVRYAEDERGPNP